MNEVDESFYITDVEAVLARKFQKKHRKECRLVMGWRYSYSGNNGIGAALEISCRECGASKDITDYLSW